MSRLQKLYDDQIHASLSEKFSYKNKFEAPKIKKIVLNMGLGEGKEELHPGVFPYAESDSPGNLQALEYPEHPAAQAAYKRRPPI